MQAIAGKTEQTQEQVQWIPFSGTGSYSGVVGGGQFGYNWQTGNIILGLETDFQGSGVNHISHSSCGVGCNVVEPIGTNWLGTARGRIGYNFQPFMVYATGGLCLIQTYSIGPLLTALLYSISLVLTLDMSLAPVPKWMIF